MTVFSRSKKSGLLLNSSISVNGRGGAVYALIGISFGRSKSSSEMQLAFFPLLLDFLYTSKDKFGQLFSTYTLLHAIAQLLADLIQRSLRDAWRITMPTRGRFRYQIEKLKMQVSCRNARCFLQGKLAVGWHKVFYLADLRLQLFKLTLLSQLPLLSRQSTCS